MQSGHGKGASIRCSADIDEKAMATTKLLMIEARLQDRQSSLRSDRLSNNYCLYHAAVFVHSNKRSFPIEMPGKIVGHYFSMTCGVNTSHYSRLMCACI